MIDVFEDKYAFLSNFYEFPIEFEGITYPTNEHFFQAMKTFSIDERKAIAGKETPGQAKRMGRHVQLRPDWEEIKADVMLIGLRLKFKDTALEPLLLATGTEWLKEGNWWHDNTWGDCCCEKCIHINGKNLLGRLLMQVRAEIHSEEADK